MPHGNPWIVVTTMRVYGEKPGRVRWCFDLVGHRTRAEARRAAKTTPGVHPGWKGWGFRVSVIRRSEWKEGRRHG